MNLFDLPTGIPYLSIIWGVMMLGAIVIMFTPGENKNFIRWTSVACSGVSMVVALLLYLAYDPAGATFQFLERVS